ncbi:MAG: aminotransferase class IV [Deltaproteobacteria bacterium]|nr:aminotransferase class IV [Deltaproteobacteria bacterium]
MGRIVVIDGTRCVPEEARVSVYDRGFLYGDSVFETVRTYGAVPFALAEHVARLGRSAALVGIRLPLSEPALGAEIAQAVAAAGNPESYARIMLSRGSGPLGLDPGLASAPLRVVLVEPLPPAPPEPYRDGIAVIAVHTVRASDAAHSAKLGNYLASALALRDARAAGASDALVLDRAGGIVEGTTANVFFVRRQRPDGPPVLVTPALEAGVLEGITRAVVLRVAQEEGLQVRFAAPTVAEARQTDEVFLTSSVREIVPVVRIDGEPVGAGRPGEITRALHRALRRHAGAGDAPMPWE